MKRLLLSIFLLTNLSGLAQPFGNEWVDYSQPYFKFIVSEGRVVNITYDTLAQTLSNQGFSISGIDPRNIQIFNRGEEQHIFIEGESDGSFDPGDRIELYVKGNDGFIENELFLDPTDNGNPYYSEINDSINYYLTWNNSLINARMEIETDVDIDQYSATPYIIRESVKELHKYLDWPMYRGQRFPPVSGLETPGYTGGEGHYGYYFDANFIDEFWYPNTRYKYEAGPDAEIEISLVGLSDDHKNLRISFAGIAVDTSLEGFDVVKLNFTRPTASLSSDSTQFVFEVPDTDPVNYGYRALVAYVKVKYPITPFLTGFNGNNFIVNNNPNYPTQAKSRLNIIAESYVAPVVYDLTQHKRIPAVQVGANLAVIIPDNGLDKRCVLIEGNAGSQHKVGVLEPAGKNTTAYFSDLNNLDSSTEYFVIGHRKFYDEIEAYATYRTSTGQPAIALDVEELYAQFGFGVPKNPLGIRKFSQWALANLANPRHIFLVGKSLGISSIRKNPELSTQCLVPSYGEPPTDNWFTAYLTNNGTEEPGIAVGRLAATSPNQVSSYLQKVIEYENTGYELWKKKGLHFSGGSSEAEATSIRNMLDSYKGFFEDTLIGGNVQTFQKTTSEPFQITQVDSIENLINNGVQLVTFFGHGSSVGFDVSIDHPSTFENSNGKYPVMLGLSCFAGDIHQPSGVGSMSESWVLEPDGGALGFIATTGPGKRFYLNNYFSKWYQNLSQDKYGRSIGEVMRHTIYENSQLSNPVTTIHNLGNTLHGDPSLVITSATLPDLKTSVPEVFTIPGNLTTLLDSFDLKIKVSNLGRAFVDSFIVEVSHVLPNGIQDSLVVLVHPPVYFDEFISIRLPIDPVNAVGINNICVSLDNTAAVEEESELNNDVCIQPLIISPDIIPVYPYEFAVVPDQGVTLKASTGNAFAPSMTYRLEVDTTDLFNSSSKQFTTTFQGGGVVEWSPKLLMNMPDSTVYFWRASIDSVTHGEYMWRESSFQYIIDKYGWGQAHFLQKKNEHFTSLEHNRTNREFDFVPLLKTLTVHNFGNPDALASPAEAASVNYYIDNGLMEYSGCAGWPITFPQILIGVLDPCTLAPWKTAGTDLNGVVQAAHGHYGQLEPCRSRPENWFQFGTGFADSLDAMANFIDNVIPDSHYVFVVTWRHVDFSTFNPIWLQPFQNLGATGIDTISYEPYIFFCKKGDPSSVIEIAGSDTNDIISLAVELSGCYNEGRIATSLIGPTSDWGSLHFRMQSQEQPTLDEFDVSVIGVTPGGVQDTVLSGLEDWVTDIPDLANTIDASQYPRLRLAATLKDDSVIQTPPQLKRWQVLFDGVPEAALDPSIHFSWSGDSLADGESMMFATAIRNISEFDMDSLLVHYWVIDENNNRVEIDYARQDSLLAGAELLDTVYYVPSSSTRGINTFWVEVNPVPVGQTAGYDQLEQYHFNNLGYLQFNAQGDDVNPIMDVTFDGVHILDGDIVSAKPLISIEVDDESEFRLLTDTSDVQVYISQPNSSSLQRIWFNNGLSMQFYPGEAPKNKAKIEFPADFPIDGTYELIVQSYDRSHNASGEQFYRISFEVINKSTITEIMNWPNPFSTNTHFVFTLTGSEPPTFFKIQIITISGKVVREIGLDELGPINIGRNITQYGWDGKDTYGDQLANGIYLYRVITRIEGDLIEHRESGADQWIEHEFGKMMLIR
ncbi:MAG: hypothetical protein ACI85F_001219 [Bacteroidia bacterium]|jgi:hypothetical protein